MVKYIDVTPAQKRKAAWAAENIAAGKVFKAEHIDYLHDYPTGLVRQQGLPEGWDPECITSDQLMKYALASLQARMERDLNYAAHVLLDLYHNRKDLGVVEWQEAATAEDYLNPKPEGWWYGNDLPDHIRFGRRDDD
ncbi:hypothetical protein [Phyllobacterium zundukense]|uniref:Uncharacterized protein n=1 Tax=Phyllobacterium zundukense TaxID=1867719 RepID=A0A2N9W054_9HYPH|nr:hypothetical protein [Phyllobacterium zundukense]ATU90637.1 hypothetical protein BLM14_02415 [Phyllobacterium zundukense]PIO45122.1 hypothetical protein B5P45_08745 [Phyllobacterium zundukense]